MFIQVHRLTINPKANEVNFSGCEFLWQVFESHNFWATFVSWKPLQHGRPRKACTRGGMERGRDGEGALAAALPELGM